MSNIRKIAKEYRDKNGNEKISNKELLFYVIAKFDKLEERITKTETKQKIFMWAIPVCMGAVAFMMSVI